MDPLGRPVYYVDDSRVQLFFSPNVEERTKWWAHHNGNTFDHQLVFERGDKPHRCYLRLRFQHEANGVKIQTILERAGIKCENLPPENFVEFIRDNKDKIYPIGENSYQITSLISDRGAFGDVFLARDLRTQAKVAIKILRDSADLEHLSLRILQRKGPHPNIVQYISDGTIWGKTWIVMEYIQGEKFDWTPELK